MNVNSYLFSVTFCQCQMSFYWKNVAVYGRLLCHSNYEKLVVDKVPDIVRGCVQFLQSEAFFLILSNLTGLRLHRLAITSPDSDEEELPSTDVAQGVITVCLFFTAVCMFASLLLGESFMMVACKDYTLPTML